MKKMCPFRKRKVATITNGIVTAWEDRFLECLQNECAMWADGCGLTKIGSTMTPPVNNETPANKSESNENNNQNNDGIDKTTVKVLEAKETKKPGTVRAWCQFDDGNKEAVFAKNGAGKTLLGSIGKEVNIKYRRLDNGTVFAVFANEA